MKVGFAVAEPVSETTGPLVCSQVYCSVRLLGSQLSLPSRVTLAPEATVCAEPVIAVGVGSELGTLMKTVSALLVVEPSLTVSEKVSLVGCDGVVKVGLTAVELLSVTTGPPVWAHWYCSVLPLEVELAEPSRVTWALGSESCMKPALATTPVVSFGLTVYWRSSHAA